MLSQISAAQAQNTCGNNYLYQGLCYPSCPKYTTAVTVSFNNNTCTEDSATLSASNGCSIPGYLKLENRCVEFCPVTTFRRFNYCMPRPMDPAANECHEVAPFRLGSMCVVINTCESTYYTTSSGQLCRPREALSLSINWCPEARPFLNIYQTSPVKPDTTHCHLACREDMTFD